MPFCSYHCILVNGIKIKTFFHWIECISFCMNMFLILSVFLSVCQSEFLMIRTMMWQDITIWYNVIQYKKWINHLFFIHFLFHWIKDTSTKKIGVDETDGGKFIFCQLLYIGFVFLWYMANFWLLLRAFFEAIFLTIKPKFIITNHNSCFT